MCSAAKQVLYLFINLCHSSFGPIPAAGYHPECMYEFKVDFDGDAVEVLLTALRSTSETNKANRVRLCDALGIQTLSTRMRHAPLLPKAQPGRDLSMLPVLRSANFL
jgi:hypothetical protein